MLGAIGSSGDVTYYASDARLKKNIRKINDAVGMLREIGGYQYEWDLERCEKLGFIPNGESEHGLIAQFVEKVFPEGVAPAAFDSEYLTVRYHRLVPLLVAAVVEQSEQILSLQQEIQTLKG